MKKYVKTANNEQKLAKIKAKISNNVQKASKMR